MIKIREEADEIASGKQPKDINVLKCAPHPFEVLTLSEEEWKRPYSREQAAYPLPALRKVKFWPSVGRIDDAYGDMHLVCECGSVGSYAEGEEGSPNQSP